MNREEILQFLNANPSCHLATTDGTRPRVRGMLLYKADSTGLVFHTGAFKALYKQITQNKHVELCFNSKDAQVRVAGIVEIIDDL
jgi:pyridoxamine 5'-phosphate oxidase